MNNCKCFHDALLVGSGKRILKKVLKKASKRMLSLVNPKIWHDSRSNRFAELINQAHNNLVGLGSSKSNSHNCDEFQDLRKTLKELLKSKATSQHQKNKVTHSVDQVLEGNCHQVEEESRHSNKFQQMANRSRPSSFECMSFMEHDLDYNEYESAEERRQVSHQSWNNIDAKLSNLSSIDDEKEFGKSFRKAGESKSIKLDMILGHRNKEHDVIFIMRFESPAITKNGNLKMALKYPKQLIDYLIELELRSTRRFQFLMEKHHELKTLMEGQ